MTYSVKQLADFFNVSNTTIRTSWPGEFANYLSERTRPPKGQERRFTEDDFLVLQTVAILRRQGVDYPDIHTQLNDGVRLEPQEGQTRPKTVINDQETALTVGAFSKALTSYETRLERLETKLEEAQEARLAAEIRAAAAEAEIKILKELTTTVGDSRGFWARLTNKKSP